MNPPPSHRPDWIEIAVQSDPATHEAVSVFLMETLGCEGVVVGASSERAVKAYLPGETPPEALALRIEAFLADLAAWFPESAASSYRLGRIQDPDWRTAWQQHFRPERVTPGLLVLPAWEPAPPEPQRQVLRVDPGPAFGTGKHPTTRMCLQALEDLAPHGRWSLLDVGTGSGILAMYGALLGASPVEGLDVDEEALRWAAWNLELNGLQGAVRLSSEPLGPRKTPFSVVTANLVLDVIRDLVPRFRDVVKPGGMLVLSGLLREQVPGVTPDLTRNGFQVVRTLRMEEWACVLAQRSGSGQADRGGSS